MVRRRSISGRSALCVGPVIDLWGWLGADCATHGTERLHPSGDYVRFFRAYRAVFFDEQRREASLTQPRRA
jgi:hypothetical protein